MELLNDGNNKIFLIFLVTYTCFSYFFYNIYMFTYYFVLIFAGKITVLQLSALLKQADSSKHKLTLTRLSSAPIPFTVLSLSGNPWNEDLLAVCGLKECHVLTFNSGGKL